MDEAMVKHMVDRFLMWKLPKDFSPDCGITFNPIFNEHAPGGPSRHQPIGTNLFDAMQAAEMVRYMLAEAPSGWRPIAEAPITPFADTPSYYTYRALIQTEDGDVHGGFARWANRPTVRRAMVPNVEVRWYADHAGRWLRDAKYFMPMPAPRAD